MVSYKREYEPLAGNLETRTDEGLSQNLLNLGQEVKPRKGMPVPTPPLFLSSPVGPFEASEVRFYCDHTIAVHFQSTEDMFILLIAKPRNQEINTQVQHCWSH